MVAPTGTRTSLHCNHCGCDTIQRRDNDSNGWHCLSCQNFTPDQFSNVLYYWLWFLLIIVIIAVVRVSWGLVTGL
jgi:hypothetical protein